MKNTGFIISLILVLTLVGCNKQIHENNTPPNIDEDVVINIKTENNYGFITIFQNTENLQKWNGENLESEVEWQHLTLSPIDAEKYPELNKRFEEINKENDAYAHETEDSFLEIIEEFPLESNAWHYYSHKKFDIQRADQYIVSIISDYDDYTGGAHGYYSKLGINISPETGKDISLEDVIRDREAFNKIVYDSILKSNPDEICEENRQSFYDTYKEHEYNWSIDYDKLTVYFNPYEIASFAAGIITVDVKFNEYPELFFEKYTLKMTRNE